ncbi:MAG TPA: hypothetical protein VIG52_01775 [Methyloceanibacter sp.]
MSEDPNELEQSSPFSDMLVAVKACGLAILVIVTVFILHEDIVGKPWPYHLFVQVVCMVAVGGGYAYTEGRADLTPWQQRLVIAGIGLAASLLTLAVMHLIR